MLSVTPLCSIVLLPSSAILTNLTLFIFHVPNNTTVSLFTVKPCCNLSLPLSVEPQLGCYVRWWNTHTMTVLHHGLYNFTVFFLAWYFCVYFYSFVKKKVIVQLFPTVFVVWPLKNGLRTFFCNPWVPFFKVEQRWAAFLPIFSEILLRYLGILFRFSGILLGFQRFCLTFQGFPCIFNKSKLLGVRFHPLYPRLLHHWCCHSWGKISTVEIFWRL